MLILTRKPGEVICIGDEIFITVVEIKGNQIRIGVDAPRSVRVFRKEIHDQIKAENKAAASAEGSLDSLSEVMGHSERKNKDQLAGYTARSPLSQFTTD